LILNSPGETPVSPYIASYNIIYVIVDAQLSILYLLIFTKTNVFAGVPLALILLLNGYTGDSKDRHDKDCERVVIVSYNEYPVHDSFLILKVLVECRHL
jgi:hypothetical protein